MAKNPPKSQPVGNTDDSKRGRGIDKQSGRPSKHTDPKKKIGPDDYEGHRIGRRGK